MKIRINCENQNKRRRIDLVKVKKAARIALKELKKNKSEINIDFFSDQKIKGLNRRYLGINKATDVMAFPCQVSSVKYQVSSDISGDIAISSDTAARNSKLYGTTFLEELILYVIHGILHLAGYKDKTKKERGLIRRKEHEILQRTRRIL